MQRTTRGVVVRPDVGALNDRAAARRSYWVIWDGLQRWFDGRVSMMRHLFVKTSWIGKEGERGKGMLVTWMCSIIKPRIATERTKWVRKTGGTMLVKEPYSTYDMMQEYT
jgi:hypothetical protein